MSGILVSDYDGTITRNDFYSLLAERYIPPDAPDFFAQYRAGRISHFEAMAGYFSFAPAGVPALDELLEASQPDPALSEAGRLLERFGWELIIVSAGSSWYIERVLARAGVRATVVSNPGRIVPGRGLVIEKPPRESPFYSEDVGVDKVAVVRAAQRRADAVAFAGDGLPDIQAALLVQPSLLFARGQLAAELTARGCAYSSFDRWSEVAASVTALYS